MTLRLSPTHAARLRGAIPHVDLDSARFLGAGWHVLAYRAGSWTIRIPRVERGRELIDRQTRLYRVLSANGLPVPRDARVARGDAGAVVAGLYRYIAGEPAAPRSLGATLARELGAFLTSLHTLSTDLLRSICGVEADPWGGHYEPAFLRCRPFLPPEFREWLDASVAAYLEARAGLDAGCLVLVHADLSGEHILVDGEGHQIGRAHV